MLATNGKLKSYWCLDESLKVVVYTNKYEYKLREHAYPLKTHLAEGNVRPLGPVCLGFWRG